MQILLIQPEICHIFHYHVNIISKLVTEFVTELVKIVHFFSVVTNFRVQAIRNQSFYFPDPFVLMILFCNNGYIKIIVYVVTFVKMFCRFAVVWPDGVALFLEKRSESFSVVLREAF